MHSIFIAEIIPSYNKGEAAILHGIVKSLRKYLSNAKIYLCSRNPGLDAAEYGEAVSLIDSAGLIPVEAGKFEKIVQFLVNSPAHIAFALAYRIFGGKCLFLFRKPLWRAYAESSVLIVGHDNSFSKYHFPLIWFGRFIGKRVVVYGTTIMPRVLNSRGIKWIAKRTLNSVSLITCREMLTYRALKEMDLGVPLYCTADKAFLLEPCAGSVAEASFRDSGFARLKRPILGVMAVKSGNVFDAAFQKLPIPPEEKYRNHVVCLAKALDHVLMQTDGSAVFIPHCVGPTSGCDDRLVARDIRAAMKMSERVVLLEDDVPAPMLKGLMGKLDMVVTERTHGGIAAATMGIPTLWITHSGDRRTQGIVRETLEVPECLYEITTLTQSSMQEAILNTWEKRQEIRKKLAQSVPKAQSLSASNGFYFHKYINGQSNK